MCGIVGGVAERNIAPILLEGLKRLEYRGYDSAGVGLIEKNTLHICKAAGKVQVLADKVKASKIRGLTGIAHTRWATHGIPSEKNAHPHASSEEIALVHNGIIENYLEIKAELASKYEFKSDTDSEVIAHLIHFYYAQSQDFADAVKQAISRLKGAYALAVICRNNPEQLFAASRGAPLVIGIGIGEHFVASDSFALLPVTRQFIYLEDGDLAEISRENFTIWDKNGKETERQVQEILQEGGTDGAKAGFSHFMQKEIYEQPSVIAATLEGRIHAGEIQTTSIAPQFLERLKEVEHIQIIACGTSYHAGLVAKYRLEELGITTTIEVASEYLYRPNAVARNSLFITISQSGETADTLAALEKAKKLPYLDYLTICNVAESALVRASNFALLTRAGREIGVASTKAFTTQLVVLDFLAMLISQAKKITINSSTIAAYGNISSEIKRLLALNEEIKKIAAEIKDAKSCLFLGRGAAYPIACEAALKLKELTYIHAESYPCGELKHGPLALVDKTMPVIAIVQAGELGEKTMNNLNEVQARGGRLIVFADSRVNTKTIHTENIVLPLGNCDNAIFPILSIVPLQLLAYNCALLKGTDIDQPRNLAKSVTVE